MGNQCCGQIPTHQNNNVHQVNQNNIQLTPIKKKIEDPVVICEICRQGKRPQYINEHIDICHYGYVTAPSQILCLLCNNRSSSIADHGNHVKLLHPYMQQHTKEVILMQAMGRQLQLNSKLKKNVQQVGKLQIFLNKDGRTAQIQDDTYDMYVFEQVYSNQQLRKSNPKADLVWSYIFRRLKTAKYYNLQVIQTQKSNIARSKIFVLRGYVPP